MLQERPTCGVCGTGNPRRLWRVDFDDLDVWNFIKKYYIDRVPKACVEGKAYELVECATCGFIWQYRVLCPEDMTRLYEEWILPELSLQKKSAADILLFAGYAAEVQCVATLLKKKPGEIRVLDFRMGWGFWCLMARAWGYRVSGFEFSQSRNAFARKNGTEVLENYEEIRKRKFDFINVEQVFEHLIEPLQALKILVQSLNDDGIIRIATPNGADMKNKLRNPNWRPGKDCLDPMEHINCYSRSVLIDLARRAGLRMIPPPFFIVREPGLMALIRTIAAKYKKQFFGTTIYFKKNL